MADRKEQKEQKEQQHFELPEPNADMQPARHRRRLGRSPSITGPIASIDEAIAAAAAARFDPVGPRHVKHVSSRRAGWRFDWSLLDHAVSPHRQIAHGQAWTNGGAWRAAQRALEAELDRLSAVQRAHVEALVEDAARDGGCE